jgi:hypothetical protein
VIFFVNRLILAIVRQLEFSFISDERTSGFFMSHLYQLPCTCGQTVSVSAAQAGRTVECGCGVSLTVPSLGVLRNQQPTEKERAQELPTAWHPLQGVLFVGGVLVLLIAASSGGYAIYKASKINIQDRSKIVEAQSQEELNKMSVDEVYELWRGIETLKLSNTQGPRATRARAELKQWQTMSTVSFGIAAVGLVSVILSLGNSKTVAPASG